MDTDKCKKCKHLFITTYLGDFCIYPNSSYRAGDKNVVQLDKVDKCPRPPEDIIYEQDIVPNE